jgi:hypothetical protein
VQALDAMVGGPTGGARDLDLPGHLRAERRDGVIRFRSTRPGPAGPVAG